MSFRTIQKFYLILFVLLNTNAFAYGVPPIPSSGSAVTDNKIYGGLKWDFNGGIKPEAVIGFRSARVNPSSYTNGGDISISAKFIDSFEVGKARLKYFSGIDTVQAEVSSGYDFKQGIFVGGSVKAPYSNLGVDYLFKSQDNKLQPYLAIDTLGKYKKPNASITCPAGAFYDPTYIWIRDGFIDDQRCQYPLPP